MCTFSTSDRLAHVQRAETGDIGLVREIITQHSDIILACTKYTVNEHYCPLNIPLD